MKKILSLVLCLLIVSTCTSICFGEATSPVVSKVQLSDDTPPYRGNVFKYPKQNVRVKITRIQANKDGSTTSTVITPVVAQVTYKYYVVWNTSTQTYTDGDIIVSSSYPRVDITTTNSDYGVSHQTSQKVLPTNENLSLNGASYTATLSGGRFVIRHYTTIYYDANGNFVSGNSTMGSTTFGFYMNDSGSGAP